MAYPKQIAVSFNGLLYTYTVLVHDCSVFLNEDSHVLSVYVCVCVCV